MNLSTICHFISLETNKLNEYIRILQNLNEVSDFDYFESSNKYLQIQLNQDANICESTVNTVVEYTKTLIHLYYFQKYPCELLESYLPVRIELIFVLSLSEESFERAVSSFSSKNEKVKILKLLVKDFVNLLNKNPLLLKYKDKIDTVKFLKEFDMKMIEDRNSHQECIIYLCSYTIYMKLPYNSYNFQFTLKNESIYIISVISLILYYNDEILYRIDIDKELNSFISGDSSNKCPSVIVNVNNIPYMNYKGYWVFQWCKEVKEGEEVLWSSINYQPINYHYC